MQICVTKTKTNHLISLLIFCIVLISNVFVIETWLSDTHNHVGNSVHLFWPLLSYDATQSLLFPATAESFYHNILLWVQGGIVTHTPLTTACW